MENQGNKIVRVLCKSDYINERGETLNVSSWDATKMFEDYYKSLVELRKNNPKLLACAKEDALKATCVNCKYLSREILDKKLATYNNLQTLLIWQDENGNRGNLLDRNRIRVI